MSETPGPKASLPSMRNGRAFAVPSGKTVSRWPSSRTWSLARPRAGTVAFRKKPAVGWSVTSQAMPRASRCACRILPARSTPALSAEPESVSTSAPSRATMGSYWVSSQASTSASRGVIGMGSPSGDGPAVSCTKARP